MKTKPQKRLEAVQRLERDYVPGKQLLQEVQNEILAKRHKEAKRLRAAFNL